MLPIVHIAGVISFVIYTVSAVVFLTSVIRRSDRTIALGNRCAGLAFFFHTVAFAGVVVGDGISSLVGAGGDYYFLFSWLLALSFLVGLLRFSYPILGAFATPAIVLALGGSSYMMHLSVDTEGASHTHPLILLLHIVPALCAEVTLFFAFVVSAAYLGQERRIRQKSMDAFSLRGPSLERLDFLQGRFVLIGFIAMSFAVLSGVLWGVSQQRALSWGDFSQWASLLAWGLLGVILFLRHRIAWSARRLARITAITAGLYFIGLILVVLLGGGVLHAFGRMS